MGFNAAQKLLASIGAPFETGTARKYGKRRLSKAATVAKGRRRKHEANRADKLVRNADRIAKAQELIHLGRQAKEEARQQRAFRLGRDYSPMPGYQNFISAQGGTA
ncbi:MAG: hypothetical protein ACPHN2_08840 [Sinimarinibacterium flocculans]|uniref:hypothetical protein n=1 Tax=Sinimarinibacterium flocculans TaxID=985250 RepID=UPI003C4C92BD